MQHGSSSTRNLAAAACTAGNKTNPKLNDQLRPQFSATARCPSQTFQHATDAKCRLRRTTSQTRFDDLAASAEKLPECKLLTLSRRCWTAVFIFAILARLSAYRAHRRCTWPLTSRGLLEEGQSTSLIERATARSTTRFVASEADVLGE